MLHDLTVLFALAVSAFTMITVLMATFIFVPQGKMTARCVKWSANYTNFNKFAYWGVPVFLLLFISSTAAIMFFIAAIVGLTFKKRYIAHYTKTNTITPPPIPVA